MLGQVLFIILILFSHFSQAEEIEKIPSPRPAGWIVDLSGQIQSDTLYQVNQAINAINKSHGAEIAVVVIETTSGTSPRTFATRLFNHWGIGDPVRNDGLLIMAALKDRKAEIILGDGLSQFTTITDDIMTNIMVAHFKKNDPNAAILQTVKASIKRLYQNRPRPPTTGDRFMHKLQPVYSHPLGIFGIFGALFTFIVLYVKRLHRLRPRNCQRCGDKMQRFDEINDDKFLKPLQQLEEKLGSVDYDVWACRSCFHTTKEAYNAFFSSYTQCPKCHGKTLKSDSQVIQAATTHSKGKKKVTYRCLYCQHSEQKIVSIPIIKRTSSSSSGFSGGRSSGSGSSGSW